MLEQELRQQVALNQMELCLQLYQIQSLVLQFAQKLVQEQLMLLVLQK
jgi:hypothetical protein